MAASLRLDSMECQTIFSDPRSSICAGTKDKSDMLRMLHWLLCNLQGSRLNTYTTFLSCFNSLLVNSFRISRNSRHGGGADGSSTASLLLWTANRIPARWSEMIASRFFMASKPNDSANRFANSWNKPNQELIRISLSQHKNFSLPWDRWMLASSSTHKLSRLPFVFLCKWWSSSSTLSAHSWFYWFLVLFPLLPW